jgi:hypothetical protein
MTYNGIILSIVAVLTCAPAALAQDADVSGTWTATFVTNGQSYPAKMIIKEEGAKTTGTISSERGEFPITGAVKGQTVTFSFTMQGENGPITIAMNADVDGNTMKGTFDHGGGGGAGTWSATRGEAQGNEPAKRDAPAEKVDVTGTWDFSIELPDISGTVAVLFKQDGESLTGEYQSRQYGRFPLKGTIKGNRIDFGFEMSINGDAVSVSYSGSVVDNDTMKGEMSYGGLTDGTFTAARRK